jgi:hypothetical protein
MNRFVEPPRVDGALAGFLADVRATYVSDPDEAVAARHLTAIAREARSAPDQEERRADGRGPSV